MPELVFLLLRLGFLAVLWLFVLLVVRAIRLDVLGPRAPKRLREPAAQRAAPAPRSKPAPAPKKQRRATKLVVVEGPGKGTSVALGEEPVTIGRAGDVTLVLEDTYASQHHARLVPDGTGWVLEDLGSTNGTFVGAQRLTKPFPLPTGTQLKIGETVLELRP
jgi:pSer/pThr/pTyr-binding forkhead associated (FHA) protein